MLLTLCPSCLASSRAFLSRSSSTRFPCRITSRFLVSVLEPTGVACSWGDAVEAAWALFGGAEPGTATGAASICEQDSAHACITPLSAFDLGQVHYQASRPC
jgi:hypothetical protein